MKVLFLVPPETLSIESSVPKALEGGKGYYPKLGLLYVASHLECATGIRPGFIDCPAEGIDYEMLPFKIREFEPDLVGISVLTFNLLDACETARLVKALHPGAKVCFGGVHVSLYPQETLCLPQVDFIVHGEGERSFTWLVEELGRGASLERLQQIPGLGVKVDGEIFLNPTKDAIPNLDALPMPARHLIDPKKYAHIIGKGHQFSTIQSSRGCPFACTFCDMRRTRFRVRTAENVLTEIRHMYENGVDDFFFVDDTITVQKKRLHDICRLIANSGMNVHFKISARVDTVDEAILGDLRRAGCYRIHYGVETATPRLLEYMEKGTTLEQVEHAFSLTKRAGIGAFAYMMIGIPTETYGEMQNSIEFAVKLDAEYAQFSICTPYPKTELYFRMLRDGFVPSDYWQEFAEHPAKDFRIKFWNPDFTEEQLRDIQEEAHQRFYGRPLYILREMLKVRSLADFNAKVRMGTRVLMGLREEKGGSLEPPEVYVDTHS